MAEEMKLYPFQIDGVKFLEQRRGRGLIADEPGLGKTVQALELLRRHSFTFPAVVVCPASVKVHWQRHAENMLNGAKVQMISGRSPVKITGDIILVNWDILKYHLSALQIRGHKTGIFDESHVCRNVYSQRSKAMKALCLPLPYVVCLSGTPIVNRPIEFWRTIRAIDRKLFTWEQYTNRYCDNGYRYVPGQGYKRDLNGAKNKLELHKILTDTIMIRRTKEEVLPQLPNKTRALVPMEIDRTKYEQAKQEFLDWLREQDKDRDIAVLGKLEKLRQQAIESKMEQVIEWVGDYSGKLVVFATHTKTLDILQEKFKNTCVRIDGKTPQNKRQAIVDQFQTKERIKLFLGNVQAAGVGITLTAASAAAFVELPWSSTELDQAEDRIHRIGQKDACMIYYLLAAGTIEEEIAELLDRKRRTVMAILDGKDVETEILLSELLSKYEEKE